ncbi:MAG: AAA family ATPase [bacterium]|nr:AAA family ATPase [bacterium]
MPQEIERRFLIRELKRPWPQVLKLDRIYQGYLEQANTSRSLRVRIYGDDTAVLTIKEGRGLVREELEESISFAMGRSLLERADHCLEKYRYHLEGGWELDIYRGVLTGITILEMENPEPDLTLPKWAEGEEVTDSLTNLHLARLATQLNGAGENFNLFYTHLLKRLPTMVITGGPCSGKSSVMAVLKEEFPNVHFVPEVASIVIGQLGIVPIGSKLSQRTLQEAIYRVQSLFESTSLDFAASEGKEAVIFDRGSMDGAAYFSGGVKGFEKTFRTTAVAEYAKYGKVICLGVPSKTVYDEMKSNNPVRKETHRQALMLDRSIQWAWNIHNRYLYVSPVPIWEEKVEQVRREIKKFLAKK